MGNLKTLGYYIVDKNKTTALYYYLYREINKNYLQGR